MAPGVSDEDLLQLLPMILQLVVQLQLLMEPNLAIFDSGNSLEIRLLQAAWFKVRRRLRERQKLGRGRPALCRLPPVEKPNSLSFDNICYYAN